MAKEVDLQKIELKVSVNCCEGCKRKVKKLLRSVEGVLKTEIDPSQPKVTVIGNVDPQILVKRLLKSGKQAEILRISGTEKSDNKEAQVGAVSGQHKVKDLDASCKNSTCDQKKCSNNGDGAGNSDQKKENNVNCSDKGLKKDKKECQSVTTTTTTTPEQLQVGKNVSPEPNYNIEPGMVHDTGNATTYTQYCYVMEPSRIPLPYFMSPHVVSPTPIPIYYGGEHHCCERSMYQPSVTRVGDYFSDENTVGCHVM